MANIDEMSEILIKHSEGVLKDEIESICNNYTTSAERHETLKMRLKSLITIAENLGNFKAAYQSLIDVRQKRDELEN